jgi:hypothetical protein
MSELAGSRHDGGMQSQAQRDKKTLDIFAGTLVFIGVVVLGGGFLVLAHLIVGLDDQVSNALFWVIAGVGAALSVRYLVRRK